MDVKNYLEFVRIDRIGLFAHKRYRIMLELKDGDTSTILCKKTGYCYASLLDVLKLLEKLDLINFERKSKKFGKKESINKYIYFTKTGKEWRNKIKIIGGLL